MIVPASRSRTITAVATTLAISISFPGCTSAPPPVPTTTALAETPRRPPEPRPGLVVERLRVRGDHARLDTALAALAETASSPSEAERWRREGFLVRIIDEDELADFEATLGPDVVPVRTWHGEATGWRSAARRRLTRGSVILLDGRARPIDDRLLTLAVRGWSVPLVDGAGVQIELVPHLQSTTIDPLSPPPPPGEFRGVPLTPAIERVLQSDEVLLVAAVQNRRQATPSMNDGEPESDDRSAGGETARTNPAEDSPPASSGAGPGPDGGLPPTLASCLVGAPIAGERGVLLIRGRPHPAVGLPSETSANPAEADRIR